MAILEQAKKDVLLACKAMVDRDLTFGTGGNISRRVENEELFVITPSGMDYLSITEDDLIIVDFDGNIVEGKRKPSIEASMHRLILKDKPEMNSVVHTHSFYTTVFVSTKKAKTLPVFNSEGLYYLGGEIIVTEYAPSGSQELADLAVEGIKGKKAVLLKNHGAISVGRSMEEAIETAEVLERCCQAMLLAELLGGIEELPKEIVEKFAD